MFDVPLSSTSVVEDMRPTKLPLLMIKGSVFLRKVLLEVPFNPRPQIMHLIKQTNPARNPNNLRKFLTSIYMQINHDFSPALPTQFYMSNSHRRMKLQFLLYKIQNRPAYLNQIVDQSV